MEARKYDLPRRFLCGIDWLFRQYLAIAGRVRFSVLCWLWGVERAGKGCFIGKIVIRNTHNGRISLGRGVIINSNPVANVVGVTGAAMLDTRKGGCISIGDGSGLTSPVLSSKIGISIGRNAQIGANVKIFDHNFHAMDADERRKHGGDSNPREIVVGDDVFIGTNAIILKGTKIGDRSVIAAGSVVFGLEIPPDSLVRGNPAVIVKRQ